ncbi:MAG TPA: heme o synthase [Methylovirgula sp.]|nr:heme o synthase [Methylovirgula sp.]
MTFVGESRSVSGLAAISAAGPDDYVALLKPRVMSLVVFTALTGLVLSPQHVNIVIGFASLLAIAVGAGAAGALNMWYDADIDAVMRRTSRRPIPTGKVTRQEALAFGLTLAIFAVLTLGLVANLLAAALLAFTIFFYVVIYTMWLKRLTPQNIVIGGAAGALPPVVGYVAATGQVSLAALVLFAIIFVWTPPHFWALALVRSGDYGRAGVPMMPNVKGADRTRLEILIYSLVLAALGVLPFVLGFASPVYGVVSAALGAAFVGLAWQVYRLREGDRANKCAMRLFGFSILYLFLLFAEILSERLIASAMGFLR